MATAVGLPSAGASAKVPAGGMPLIAALGPAGYAGSLPREVSGCLLSLLWPLSVKSGRGPFRAPPGVCALSGAGGWSLALLSTSLHTPHPQGSVRMRNALRPELALPGVLAREPPSPVARLPGDPYPPGTDPSSGSGWRLAPLHWLPVAPSCGLDRPLAGVCLRVYSMLTATQNSAWALTALGPAPAPPSMACVTL